jgi:bacterioferritin-associated ferredoxin
MAIKSRSLPEPKVIKLDYSDVDPVAIKELCDRAGLDPERAICVCTLTKAKETAAAIIKGARTMKELAAMTGVKSDCGGWCLDPVGRLLEAYGIDVKFPENAKGGYPMKTRLRDVSEEVAKKYPEFRIEEDKKLLEKGELPFLPEML